MRLTWGDKVCSGALLFLMSTRGHRMNTSEHTYQCVDTPSGNANPQNENILGKKNFT